MLNDKLLENLPQGWSISTLGQVLPLTYGVGLPKKERDEAGSIPVYGSNGVVGFHSTAITEKPCLIVGRKGAAGAVHYSQVPCWPIDTTYYCEATPSTNLRFFYYLLQYLSLPVLDRSTAIPSLSRDDYSSILVPIPPGDEQSRIVSKIEELFSHLDAGVAALQRAKANLKRYRAVVLKAAVEGRLTAEWRAKHPDVEPACELLKRILAERQRKWEEEQLAKYAAMATVPPKNWREKYREPVKPDVASLPPLPEGWCWATVDQLAEVGTGSTPLRTNPDYWQGGTIPWVTSTAVNEPFIRDCREMVTEVAVKKTNLVIYPKGTLLLALYGEGKTRGMVSELLIDATINQALAALVTHGEAKRCKDYLKLLLAHYYSRIRSESAGGVQSNLNLGIVRNLLVPLPPLERDP